MLQANLSCSLEPIKRPQRSCQDGYSSLYCESHARGAWRNSMKSSTINRTFANATAMTTKPTLWTASEDLKVSK
jgi:hypothetical protein